MDRFTLIQGATLVNEGATFQADVLIHNAHIARLRHRASTSIPLHRWLQCHPLATASLNL